MERKGEEGRRQGEGDKRVERGIIQRGIDRHEQRSYNRCDDLLRGGLEISRAIRDFSLADFRPASVRWFPQIVNCDAAKGRVGMRTISPSKMRRGFVRRNVFLRPVPGASDDEPRGTGRDRGRMGIGSACSSRSERPFSRFAASCQEQDSPGRPLFRGLRRCLAATPTGSRGSLVAFFLRNFAGR